MSEWILRELELMLLLSILIIGAVLIAKLIGKRTGYRWRKLLWLLIAIRLVVPVGIFDEAVAKMMALQQPAQEQVQQVVIEIALPEWNVEEEVIVLGDETVVNASKIDEAIVQEKNLLVAVRSILFRHGVKAAGILWGVGALFLLGVGSIQYFSLKRKYLKEAIVCEAESVHTLWKSICHSRNGRVPKILVCNRISILVND